MATKTLQLPPYLKALAVLSLLIVVIFILIIGKSILIPLALAAFFAVLFTPMSLFLERYRFPRVLSSLISLVLMVGLVAGLLSFIVSNLISFSTDFADVSVRITTLIQQVDQFTSTQLGFQQKLADQLDPDALLGLLNKNSSSISAYAINAIGSLSSLILIPVFMFFFLLYRDHLVNVLISIFRDADPSEVKSQLIRLRKVVLNYISGVGKVMVILAVLNITAYSLIGVEHAVFFGIIGAILNIIPYVGPFIGALLPMSYALLTMDNLLSPLLILAAYQAIQLLEGNFLTPKIVGSQVNLNAFLTFLGLLLGASIWGVAGMILIIPILAILCEIFDLSDSTKPYALLLGEEVKEKNLNPRMMKNLISKILLFIPIIWIGCDSIDDQKGRFLLKGNKKMEENDPKTALGFYEEAIALDSNFSDAYYNKGMAHLRLNQLEEAIQDFGKTLQKNPTYVDAVFQRGLAYLDLGANYNAKEDASRMVSESPADWRSYFLAGLTEEKLKNYPAALQSFQKASELAPENSDLLVNQATIRFYQKEYTGAKTLLEKAEEINPLEPNLHNLRSMIYFEEKDYPRAVQAVEKAIALDNRQAYFYNNHGLYLLYLNQLEEGLTLINQSLAMDSKNPFALRNKGIYYTLKDDKVSALSYLEELAVSHPDMDLVQEYLTKARAL